MGKKNKPILYDSESGDNILVQSTYKNQLSFSTYTYIQMHSTYSYILQPKGIIYPNESLRSSKTNAALGCCREKAN